MVERLYDRLPSSADEIAALRALAEMLVGELKRLKRYYHTDPVCSAPECERIRAALSQARALGIEGKP